MKYKILILLFINGIIAYSCGSAIISPQYFPISGIRGEGSFDIKELIYENPDRRDIGAASLTVDIPYFVTTALEKELAKAGFRKDEHSDVLIGGKILNLDMVFRPGSYGTESYSCEVVIDLIIMSKSTQKALYHKTHQGNSMMPMKYGDAASKTLYESLQMCFKNFLDDRVALSSIGGENVVSADGGECKEPDWYKRPQTSDEFFYYFTGHGADFDKDKSRTEAISNAYATGAKLIGSIVEAEAKMKIQTKMKNLDEEKKKEILEQVQLKTQQTVIKDAIILDQTTIFCEGKNNTYIQIKVQKTSVNKIIDGIGHAE